MRALALSLVLLACDGAPGPLDAASDDASRDGARCLDDARVEVCAGGACETTRCRGDALCVEAACIPWAEADFTCGFELTRSAAVERQVFVQVDRGGFPRAQVHSLRFDFGDGVAGWGETLRHTYAAPGVYLVTLDVRTREGRTCQRRELAVIDPPAAHDPLRLTVNEIPELLNGSLPIERPGAPPERFVLALPPEGFTVDVAALEAPGDPVEGLALFAGERALTEGLRFEDGPIRRGTWRADAPLPIGALTFALEARTRSGRALRRELTVEIVPFGPSQRPAEPPILWLLRGDVDVFTTRREGDRLLSTPSPNGLPDLAEELALIGAQGPDAAANARYLRWIEDEIRAEVYRIYGVTPDGTPRDDIPLAIAWHHEPGAPDPAAFSPSGAFSMMRFGGTFDGYVGFSRISPWYAERIDDSTAEYGVATAGLVSILISTPVISDVLAPLAETPVGAHPLDGAALDPAFDAYALDADPDVLARHTTLRTIARYLALVVSSVTAHEMGHAMGLMPNGIPPAGFFGDVTDVPFVSPARTNRWHADLPGLNLMQAGGDYLGVIDDALRVLELPRGVDLIRIAEILALENRLSAYSRAYMQGRLTYLDDGSGEGTLRVGCRHR